MQLENIKRYAYLLKTFRNGIDIVQNLRHGGLLANGPPLGEAVLWSGDRIRHPVQRAGLVGSIVEVWYENTYRIGSFYQPKAGDVVLDVGANVGLFSIWLSEKEPGCRILALEMSPENYPCLEQNVRSHTNVEALRVAIGAKPGYVRTILETNRSIDARVVEAQADEPDAVEVITLEGLVERSGVERIAFLKMDVEGAERDVFEAASDEVLERIDLYGMEYHDNYRPGTLALLQKRLEPTHEVTVLPDGDTAHGRLFAKRKR